MSQDGKPTPSPKVSIGLPVYNGEEYIREALDSLLAQTLTDFELIVSDNASTDDTEAICREYAAGDQRIRYVRQRENRGALANFQFVLDEAGGEYFMWAAADDRWDPDWLTALLSEFDTGVSIAFGSVAPFFDLDRPGSTFVLKSLAGPATIRMVRYYLWRESGAKACAIYGLYLTAELRKVAHAVFAGRTDKDWGADVILVFTMLGVGCLRVTTAAALYKRVRIRREADAGRNVSLASIPVWAAKRFFGSSKGKWLPYLIGHVQHSPRGGARWAVLAAAPFKYVHLALNWLRGGIAGNWGGTGARRWLAGSRNNDWAAEVRRLVSAPAPRPKPRMP